MRTLSVNELQWLVGNHEPPCLSLYMPAHRHAPGTEQDPIRFRGLVKKASELLAKRFEPRQVDAYVTALSSLDEPDFWRHQEDGLAVFHARGSHAVFRLGESVRELVVVADSFHITPLVRFFGRNRRFYVLSVSRNAARLWSGDRNGVEPVDLAGLPADLRSALGVEEHERHMGLRSSGRGPVYHGAGAGEEDRKQELSRYFRAVDKALWQHLRDERAPLVLAAVGYCHPIYREVSRYPDLLEEGLEGNFEEATAADIHRAAWPLVSREFEREEAAAVALYRERSAAGRGSDALEAVAGAVVQGRVRDLLVAVDRQVWGVIDRGTGRITLHAQQEGPDDADVLDDLAEMTLVRGGRVLALAAARMPTRSPVAAVYRY